MMEELREEYLRVLPERMKLIRSFQTPPDWDKLYHEFHKLKGTGRTYGFNEVSEVCERVENLCRNPGERREEHLTSALDLLNYLLTCYKNNEPVNLRGHAAAAVLWSKGKA